MSPTEKPADFAFDGVLVVFEALYIELDDGLGEVVRDVEVLKVLASVWV
jgi:hypothetical protein